MQFVVRTSLSDKRDRSRCSAGRRIACFSLATLVLFLLATAGQALSPSLTDENVQRKAVIIGHSAKLYKNATGDDGTDAPFMGIYFILEGGGSGRVPVSNGPNEENPNGWLDPDSFAEWNTLQMINFESQSGRELSRIYKDATCAEAFGANGNSSCDELGSEPRRSGTRDDYRLLIPVFERSRNTYRGGFVRVSAVGPEVVPEAAASAPRNREGGKKGGGGSVLGYDLVLVVDATASMEEWFRPTTKALQRFIQWAQQQAGGGELQKPFRVGVLLYRDRKIGSDCDIGFLTDWAVDLTDDINSVTSALLNAKEATCNSDEEAEAIYDGLNRALLDPAWEEGHFKVVLLVGDAPPHSSTNEDKNPLAFTVGKITQMSTERNVRFLTFKIGTQDSREFKELAESVEEAVKGRFRSIADDDTAGYEESLYVAMRDEWGLLTKADTVAAAGIGGDQLKTDRGLQQRFKLDDYELPIIIANLPATGNSNQPSEFVEGWVAKKIKQRLAIGEYIFLPQTKAKILANVIDTIGAAAQEGVTEGSEAFISTLRQALAGMLKVQPDDIFRSGESLSGMMKKADVLPFKTTALSFTADEVNTWKPADFERLNKLMSEKIEVLREYVQKPGNLRYFGEKAHVYVPRNLFP